MKIYETDPYLLPYKEAIDLRNENIIRLKERFASEGSLSAAVNNHLYYDLHKDADGSWLFREWAPNANKIYLIGEFNNWKRSPSYSLQPMGKRN